jgi:hypothetical protein
MKKKSAPPTPPPTTPAVAMIAGEKLAALANLTPRRLYQLAKDNKIPPPINGSFPMLATITALFAFYQRDGEEIQKEKLKKLTAERQMTELKLATQQGRMAETAEVKRQIGEGVGYMFSELERRTRELPPVLAGLDSVSIFERMEAENKTIKNNLREKFASIGQ